MRILAGILVFLSLGLSSAFATSIVAVRNSDEIVIGADSKTTLTLVQSGGQTSLTKCKIVQAGDLFFASAGSAGIGPAGLPGNISPEFDLKETIAAELRGDGTMKEKVDRLEKVLVADLTRIAEKVKQDNPSFFLQKFVNAPVHTVIVGGTDKGELVLMVRTFSLISSPFRPLSFVVGRFTCPGDCRGPFVTIFEGRTEEIKEYLQQHELFLHYADPVTAVRDLVGIEVEKDPSSVGPPIDILRLTRKGAEWVQRKPLCPDIQQGPSGDRGSGGG